MYVIFRTDSHDRFRGIIGYVDNKCKAKELVQILENQGTRKNVSLMHRILREEYYPNLSDENVEIIMDDFQIIDRIDIKLLIKRNHLTIEPLLEGYQYEVMVNLNDEVNEKCM